MVTSQAKSVALVTGESAGIGKAIVRQLLHDGWTVYGAARRLDNMTDIQSEGANTLYLDVTDDDSMQMAVDQVLESEGHRRTH
ncbi:MAG: SDR family NAD(P)-dependent oxidoreductase [Synechococcus sp.]